MASDAGYLADTSVFTHLHRPSVAAALTPLVEDGQIWTGGMVDLEFLFTARNADEIRGSRGDRTIGLHRVDIVDSDFERAIDVMEELSQHGLHRAANVNDLLIAAVAERAGLTVLHYDQDFDHIASVTGQGAEWVVPKGSI